MENKVTHQNRKIVANLFSVQNPCFCTTYESNNKIHLTCWRKDLSALYSNKKAIELCPGSWKDIAVSSDLIVFTSRGFPFTRGQGIME